MLEPTSYLLRAYEKRCVHVVRGKHRRGVCAPNRRFRILLRFCPHGSGLARHRFRYLANLMLRLTGARPSSSEKGASCAVAVKRFNLVEMTNSSTLNGMPFFETTNLLRFVVLIAIL